MNAAVNVRFRGKMNNRIWTEFGEGAFDGLCIADIAQNETRPRTFSDRRQIDHVLGIRQLVEHQELIVRMGFSRAKHDPIKPAAPVTRILIYVVTPSHS